MKKNQLTKSQLTEMGYTKWEGVMVSALRLAFLSVVIAVFSLFILNPILDFVLPGNGFEHAFRVNVITLGLLFLGLIASIFFVIVAYICAIVLLSKINLVNSYRLRLPVVGMLISGMFVAIILFSTFVDYGVLRAWISLIAGIISIICVIVSYCIYYVRYRRTVEALLEAEKESGEKVV